MASILAVYEELRSEVEAFCASNAETESHGRMRSLLSKIENCGCGDSLVVLNYYKCPFCAYEWYDVYGGNVDMDCTRCEQSDISPVHSGKLKSRLLKFESSSGS